MLMEVPATFLAARLMDSAGALRRTRTVRGPRAVLPRERRYLRSPSRLLLVGRRVFNTAMLLLISASLALGAAVPPAAIASTLLGKFAATGSFNLIYVQATELFPTELRTTVRAPTV
jgi:hypothetical protein